MMELISKEVVKRIIDSGRTKEQMLGMVECAVAFRHWKSSTESTDSSTESSTESSTDCISREAVLEIIRFEDKWLLDAKSHNADTEIAFNGMLSKVNDLPSVKPKERTGHWIAVYQGDEIINYRCSECEFGNTFGKNTDGMYYCPRCGARMTESR